MAVETGSQRPPSETANEGPATSRALASGAWTLLKRFLTLREGSVIVITVLTIVCQLYESSTPYFALRDPVREVTEAVLAKLRERGIR